MVMQANPAALVPHSSEWARIAREQLSLIRHLLSGIAGIESAVFEHIGSTAVPGLAAKPSIDLQIRILPLPSDESLSALLAPIGYAPELGSRPDSPGVYRDIPRGIETVSEDVWEKHLFTAQDVPAILHVRRSDSPWGLYAVWFRDWLRAHPNARQQYEDVKRTLSRENSGKLDYDDYTRAKTHFIDSVQSEFEAWARENSHHLPRA